MSGKFPANIKAAAQDVTGTTGPETQNAIAAVGENNAVDAPPGSYAVSYQDQDGPTKYAPMVGHPPTKITAKSPTPQYPTSSVSFFKSNMTPPKQKTTQTLSQTWVTSSVENQVLPKIMQQMINARLTVPRLHLHLNPRMTCRNIWQGGRTERSYTYIILAAWHAYPRHETVP